MKHGVPWVILISVALLVTLFLASNAIASEEYAPNSHHGDSLLGESLPIWSSLPFVGILLSIALFPLFKPVWWHHNFGRVAAFWALVFALPFLFVYRGEALYEILHIYIADYIPFIILLWGLFTASGGILIRGTPISTPLVNTTILLIGTIAYQ